jgi:hypothetical protein
MKTALKWDRFQDAEDIKQNVTAEMRAAALEAFAGCSQNVSHLSRNVDM